MNTIKLRIFAVLCLPVLAPAQTPEAGAPLDVSSWAWRKQVVVTGTGLLQAELDAEVLADSQADLRDLRVLQNDRQIPWLLQRTAQRRETGVSFSEVPDPKRPRLSRWRIALPVAGFPIAEILARSPTTLFERSMSVWENTRDDFGNTTRRGLGSATWRQTPAQGSPDLSLSLSARPVSDTVFLETDNGDNAAIHLTSLRLTHSVVQLVFKVTDSAPMHLCYGNPRASAPRYDLRLVQNELAAAKKIHVTLGPVEKLSGERTGRSGDAPSPGTGSVWLWAALALVVAGLLWVVVKMLPKESAK